LAKELSEDLARLNLEVKSVESQIKTLVTYPFQKKNTGEPTAADRVITMEVRYKEVIKQADKVTQEEMAKHQELQDL
jgi:hypothetical protein